VLAKARENNIKISKKIMLMIKNGADVHSVIKYHEKRMKAKAKAVESLFKRIMAQSN
jgi:hypothetical protein